MRPPALLPLLAAALVVPVLVTAPPGGDEPGTAPLRRVAQLATPPAAVQAETNACDSGRALPTAQTLRRVSTGAVNPKTPPSEPQAESAEAVPQFRQALHRCVVDRFNPRAMLGLQKVVYRL